MVVFFGQEDVSLSTLAVLIVADIAVLTIALVHQVFTMEPALGQYTHT